MEDLLEAVLDQKQWKGVQPVVHNTLVQLTELFGKFNNKLAFMEQQLYKAANHKLDNVSQALIDKTLTKQPVVKWKSPLKETLGPKPFLKAKKKMVTEVVAQELYLDSNETMFAMVIEEIEELKRQKGGRSRQLKSSQGSGRFKQIERELERLTYLVTSSLRQNHLETNPESERKLQQLQKQLLEKPSLIDIQEVIKSEIEDFELELTNITDYIQTNLGSVNKILNHQSVINHQICREMKVGKWIWEGKSPLQLSLVPWEREVVNLFPQVVVWNENTTTLLLKTPGFYQVELFVVGGNSTLGIMINNQSSLLGERESRSFSNKYEDVVEANSNCSLSVSCEDEGLTIVMIIRKLL